MKALSLPKKGVLQLKEAPIPECIPGHAVIRMENCGICGSDITAYKGVNPTMRYPIDGIGHEGVGVISEIGDNEKGLKSGDRVVLEPYIPCNECHMCKAGRFNNCVNLRVCGVHKDGMMAEYFLQPIQQIYKLPDTLEFTHATIVEPFTIGLHAATRARVSKGEYCVVFGAGTIGLLAAFACINYGAKPILVDIIQARLDQAKKLGIPYVCNSKETDVETYLKEVTNRKLPEAMLECTGAPDILAKMHNYVCHGGRISMVGWPHGSVTINTIRCMQKELDILPCRNSCAKFPESIDLVHNKKIPTDAIITKIIELADTEPTIQDMIAHPDAYLKVVVKIQQ